MGCQHKHSPEHTSLWPLVAWASFRRRAPHHEPIGHLGPTRCPHCRHKRHSFTTPCSLASHILPQPHRQSKQPTMPRIISSNKAGRPLPWQRSPNSPTTQPRPSMNPGHQLLSGAGSVHRSKQPTEPCKRNFTSPLTQPAKP